MDPDVKPRSTTESEHPARLPKRDTLPAVSPPSPPAAPAPSGLPQDRAKVATLFATFQGLGLTDYSASLLVAHAMVSVESAETMGGLEAEHWAHTFQRLHPVPWFDLKNGNLNGFVAALKRANLKALTSSEYAAMSSHIRG